MKNCCYAFLLLISSASMSAAFANDDIWQLEKVVEVTRHGVRPPTPGSRAVIEKETNRTWPEWKTPDGFLTPHGVKAARQQGKFEAEYYRSLLLLPAACPKKQDVFIWASPLERTKATAHALAQSMFPNCHVPVYAENANQTINKGKDTLFHPTKSGQLKIDKTIVRQAALRTMSGNPKGYLAQYANDIALLKQAVCVPNAPCPVFDRLDKESTSMKKTLHNIATLGDIAGTIQLAYSDNKPWEEIAFNQAQTEEDVAKLLPLQTVSSAVSKDIPYVAQMGGSTLLQIIQLALTQDTRLSEPNMLSVPPEVRYLLLVGHDTNIAHLSTLLQFNWQLDSQLIGTAGYPKGNIPPTGSLVFERWKNTQTRGQYLRIYFQAQSLEQMRYLLPPFKEVPLLHAQWQPENSMSTPHGVMVPFHQAISFMRGQINQKAVQQIQPPVMHQQKTAVQ